jgi:hypothetical protein
VTIKKSAHPSSLPGVHPGLEQRIREAEDAEMRGETPRQLEEAQKIVRPTIDSTEPSRRAQVRTIGLVEPAYRATADGLAELAEQEVFMPGVDLDQVWDQLSEGDKIRAGATERFRLEMDTNLRLAAMPWQPPHKIGGRLDERALQRSTRNLYAEIEAYDYLLAPDSRSLLRAFIDDTHKLIGVCLKQRAVQGVESVTMHELMRDLVHKLLYQELASRRRAMGDRGIRRICGNIHLAELVYKQLRALPGFTPRDRLLMRIIHVHQDLGNTAYAARVSFRGGKLHRAYGARIFTDELNNYRILLGQKELELARSAVATHSSEELPFIPQRVLALVRAVDHLAPFAPYRVYKHFESIAGIGDYLDDLLERAQAGDVDRYLAAKESLRDILADDAIPPPLRDDLWACFRPVEKLADPIDLGELGGEVIELHYDGASPGVLTAKLDPDPFTRKYQTLFDQQQDQLLRLARATNVAPERLRTEAELRFQVAGYGTLVLQR